VLRTLEAFLIAAVIGVPLGVVLGSNEKAYRSVEFLIDFFRSTPSSALIPLFLLIFGVSDINKVAIAAFGALLIVVFNSAYGVINARKQRVMAARVMGASRGQVFKDVLIWESLQPTFVGCARRCRWRSSSSSSPRCSSAPTAASATASSTRSRS
jgi:NitT/TauT family transport system permease protein